MPNVPNIVRARLKAVSSVDRPDAAHPDANVLTAFAERSLAAPERDLVLEHVARCGECREVLALALPATEELQVVLQPSPAGARRWLTWPALRWGFVAAGIALIGSLGVVQYQRSHMQVPTASNLALHNNEGTKLRRSCPRSRASMRRAAQRASQASRKMSLQEKN